MFSGKQLKDCCIGPTVPMTIRHYPSSNEEKAHRDAGDKFIHIFSECEKPLALYKLL